MPRIRALHCNDAMLPLQHYGGMITWHYRQQTDNGCTEKKSDGVNSNDFNLPCRWKLASKLTTCVRRYTVTGLNYSPG